MVGSKMNAGGKLAYIVSNFPCYSETFILNELVELKKRGYRLTVFSLKNPREKIIQKDAVGLSRDTVYCPFLFKLGLWRAQARFLRTKPGAYLFLLSQIIRRCIKRPGVLLKNLAIFPKSVYFAYLIADSQICHVHAHFANYPATAAMVVSLLTGVPFSFTCHAHDIFYDATMLDFKINKSKTCVVISQYNRQYIMGIYPCLPDEKIKVLHCGIDLNKLIFFGPKAVKVGRRINILSVGRLMPTKGFDDLIRALKILKDEGIIFSCKIIGDGPEERRLKNLIKTLGLEKEILMAGPLIQEEIAKVYLQTDVFILASKRAKHRDVHDGIPVVLMEAMASAVPVISTRLSGIPELIEDNVNGFLVNPGDPPGIAEKIRLLNADVKLKEKLIVNANKTIFERFNIKKCVDTLEGIFYS